MPAKIIDSQNPKTKEYLAKIGEIVVLLNHLEGMVDFWIWELINAGGNANTKQQIGRRITSLLNFKNKVKLLRSLVFERFGEEKAKEFEEVANLIEECCKRRNDIAHSKWFIQYGNIEESIPPTTHKINVSKSLEPAKPFNFSKAIKDIELPELDQYAIQTNLAIEELCKFFMRS